MKNVFFILTLLSAGAIGFIIWTNHSQASSSLRIIINEIQTAGTSNSDEFIELFNPNETSIVLDGYKLTKKTKIGSSESTLVSTAKFSGIIQSRGYFLIAHPDYKEEISADLAYSGSTYYISSDNTVFLYDKDGTLLDKVGFGAVDNSNSESSPAPNPETGQSIERINFTDTANNAADFSMSTSPSPQNSSITEDDEESPDDDDPSYAPNLCTAISQNIKLNEIFPYPDTGEEFVELMNAGEECVDISGWKIMDKAGHKKEFPKNSILGPGEYLFLEGNLYLNNDSDTAYLLGKDGGAEKDALDSRNFEKARKGFSYSFDEKGWQWTSTPTPKEKNLITILDSNEEKSDTHSGENYSSEENVYLSEILPNPKKDSGDEYIEIANGEGGPVDLQGWTIRDASKSGKYVFKEHTEIEPGEYLAIYKSESKIALNNSKESVYLHNPQGEITSNVSYEKSQKDASYNFNGKNWPASNASRSDAGWKWSKYLTPGQKNKFDSEPSVKINKPKHVYKDLYTEFSVKAKDKETNKLKYAWDFGDGKKSYIAKTSHKYLDTGKYTVTLTVSDESQVVEKKFTIKVQKYPLPDLEIVKIIPNPAGADAEKEIAEIKSNSNKKIDLTGWKLATGSDSKMNNHLISGEITLEPNETKTITREICKFSLNNKSGKIHLVMPDGKVADEVAYQKEKISENEAYAKINGEWQWIAPTETEIAEEDKPSEEEDKNMVSDEENDSDSGEVLGEADENIPFYAPPQTGYTPEDAYIFFKFFGLQEYQPREANFCPAIQPANTLAYF